MCIRAFIVIVKALVASDFFLLVILRRVNTSCTQIMYTLKEAIRAEIAKIP